MIEDHRGNPNSWRIDIHGVRYDLFQEAKSGEIKGGWKFERERSEAPFCLGQSDSARNRLWLTQLGES
jgi:hypothetical protein